MIYYYDAIDIKSKKSGASAIFYYEDENTKIINLTDGGYRSSTDVINHLKKYYPSDICFNNVIVTHNDNDHAGGIKTILENYKVIKLWMLRPWIYAEQLLPRFARYKSAENLKKRLRETYSNLSELEDIAIKKRIPIYSPFQGVEIGKSLVLAPSRQRFLDLIVESDKTPQAAADEKSSIKEGFFVKAMNLIKAFWGSENFSTEGTSAENEMSVVQFIKCDDSTNYLLTGDVGKDGLAEALDYLEYYFKTIPKISLFEVPHHGSRHNLSTDLMNRMFGKPLCKPVEKGKELFKSIIHASSEDPDHPRKVVIRAIHHRGGKVDVSANGYLFGKNIPKREGWTTTKGIPYPEEQEE